MVHSLWRKLLVTNAYRLKLPESVRMHPVFNVSQLRPYIDPSEKFPGRTVEPSCRKFEARPPNHDTGNLPEVDLRPFL